MPTPDVQRHQLIRQTILAQPDAIVAVTMKLWLGLAHELVPIIGELGFQSLFARSCHLARRVHPWLRASSSQDRIEIHFADLQGSLQDRADEEAGEASILLLITLIDIIATLIGELLTSSILRSAWSNAQSNQAGKEPQQ
ncbi:hypothetical protein RCH09_002162 [Actimicrobium sp. GrIS 1.19]|uniref:hypothetical protein n=1 Tax=Actimicrobium sp. GrIS 1.19 TaxID=3071708 RepID=UPI002DFC0A9B|nr:hypothetical protein [Actimicrobium sp. GrIS 1.19]